MVRILTAAAAVAILAVGVLAARVFADSQTIAALRQQVESSVVACNSTQLRSAAQAAVDSAKGLKRVVSDPKRLPSFMH